MHYDFTAISDADDSQTVESIHQHVVSTYASEVKSFPRWRFGLVSWEFCPPALSARNRPADNRWC